MSSQMMTWKQFLETCPPGRAVKISVLAQRDSLRQIFSVAATDLELHCANESCQGVRFFRGGGGHMANIVAGANAFLYFKCRNCETTVKEFAVYLKAEDDSANSTEVSGTAFKFGEKPPFGPHVPARVISLIGPDRELFLKGRRAESQDLGIASFAYYRRVVENQKDRLLDEIARVAEHLGSDAAVVEIIKAAKTETQFAKAIDLVKEAVPQVLRINTHNPLTLLHSALSQGLHAQTDEQCLELATSIRLVLTDLAESIGQATRDHDELKRAVSRLLSRNRPERPEGAA